MEKRKLITGLLGLVSLPLLAKTAQAASGSRGSATFTVPANVGKVRVRSYLKGEKVLDRELDVTPGQIFRIDPM